ncbi:MAG: endonuclease NucS domain-containing protein, partial [Pirellula sp.]
MSKMVFESDIRNNLANCLEKLEPGLELIAIEFPLPNLIGTRGFIDILARDRFNNRVIIELKRSDQAARQAIHELHKYVALLRMKEGLSHGTIRTMLVSTEWSELRVPFAEFKRSTD